MTTQKFTQTLRRQAGYTIDQTILIVAVIAILVTMIIGSVGWDLLTRAGGTKMQSHLVQFENAAGSFFSQYGRWPHDVTADSTTAMLALIDYDAAGLAGEIPEDKFRNYLPAYETSGTEVNHPFGSGDGVVTLVHNDTDNIIEFHLTNVPSDEYIRAEEGIDGDFSEGESYHENGRLRADVNPDESRTVTLIYRANVTR